MARPSSAALALCLALPCACTTSARHAHDPQAVLREQAAAWNRGDIDAFVSSGYWASGELTFFSGGDVTRGYDATLARFRARYAEGDAEMGRLTFADLETVWSGADAALVRGRWALDFERKDDVGGLFTLFLRDFDAGWRIVHDHTSVAPATDE